MKFNWGTGMALTFALFASGMIFLASLCMKQNEDLVSLDYYNQEVAFQQQINKESNSHELAKPLQISYDHESRQVEIIFPSELKDETISGSFHFFKPDNAALDFNVAVQPASLSQSINAAEMKHGLWRVKADWKANDKSYYDEQPVVIQ